MKRIIYIADRIVVGAARIVILAVRIIVVGLAELLLFIDRFIRICGRAVFPTLGEGLSRIIPVAWQEWAKDFTPSSIKQWSARHLPYLKRRRRKIVSVSGTVYSSRMWKGTVVITGDVWIPPGVEVSVRHGTRIIFQETPSSANARFREYIKSKITSERIHIFVEGSINAQGKQKSHIEWGVNPWGGIVFLKKSGRSTFTYVRFTRGHTVCKCYADTAPEFYMCAFEDSGRYGIECFDTAAVSVTGCEFLRNYSGGIAFCDAAGGLVLENMFRNNAGAGIAVDTTGAVQIRKNSILNGSGDGISVKKGAKHHISQNTVSHHRGYGVVFFANAGGTLRQNIIKSNRFGAVTFGQSSPEIRENTFQYNNTAIVCDEYSRPVVDSNRIQMNNEGCRIMEHASVAIRRNKIASNMYLGIYGLSDGAFAIERNNIEENGTGVYLAKKSHPRIYQNNLKNNRRGIVCEEKSAPHIENNVFSQNQESIICLDDSCPVIQGNTISECNTGILCAGNSGPKILTNMFRRNTAGILQWPLSQAVIEKTNLFADNAKKIEILQVPEDTAKPEKVMPVCEDADALIDRLKKITSVTISQQTLLASSREIALDKEGNEQIAVMIPEDVLSFDSYSNEIKDDAGGVIEIIGKLALENQCVRIQIDGHTSRFANTQYSMELSIKRSKAVMLCLKDRYGIPQNILNYQGFGDSKPIVPHDSPESALKNNRIEITLYK